jgi:hypothetical protein
MASVYMETIKATPKLSSREKADLRASLPDLLATANSSPEIAQAALKACFRLRQPAPAAILTSENIASTFLLNEVARSLDCLSASEITIDLSAALDAIQVLGKREFRGTADRKALLSTVKVVTSRLTKMANPPVKASKRGGPERSKPKTQIHFTEQTLSSSAELALWFLAKLFESQSRTSRPIYPLAIRLVHAVELIWRRAAPPIAGRYAMRFIRSLPRVLPASVYAELKAEPTIADFIRDAESAIVQEATAALLDGRLKDLEGVLAVVSKQGNGRDRVLSELQGICQSRPSELVQEAVEWVARQIEMGDSRAKPPSAADESQSSELNYVAVSLLTAWDAAAEGERSTRSLESIQRLARELFKVDLMGIPGEIIVYNAQLHELRPPVNPTPTRVELIRPGVRWSDGIRTHFLVRAVVKAAS